MSVLINNERNITVKNITLQHKIMLLGGGLVILLNPLSVNILADILVTGINWATVKLVVISDYVVVAGGTLLLAGAIMGYDANNKKAAKKLKSLKHKKTESAGSFIDN
jgi:Flp pilus assembly protein TadB